MEHVFIHQSAISGVILVVETIYGYNRKRKYYFIAKTDYVFYN